VFVPPDMIGVAGAGLWIAAWNSKSFGRAYATSNVVPVDAFAPPRLVAAIGERGSNRDRAKEFVTILL